MVVWKFNKKSIQIATKEPREKQHENAEADYKVQIIDLETPNDLEKSVVGIHDSTSCQATTDEWSCPGATSK